MRLAGKATAVTGAGAGIGRAVAELFAEQGAKVGIADLDARGGKETLSLVERKGAQGFFSRTNVASHRDAERFIRETVRRFGRIDVLVNNAGIAGPPGLLSNLAEKEWDRVIGVNLKGVYLCSKHVVPYMTNQRSGVIVNIASELGLVGSESRPAYSASKGGVIALTKSTALQLAPYGIRVNCVCPGATDTKLLREFTTQPGRAKEVVDEIPLHRLGTPKEIAYAVLYLASDESSFVTGTALVVDGGSTAQ